MREVGGGGTDSPLIALSSSDFAPVDVDIFPRGWGRLKCAMAAKGGDICSPHETCGEGHESFLCTHTHEVEEGTCEGEQLIHCHHTHTYCGASEGATTKERNARAAQRYRQRKKRENQRNAQLVQQLREQNEALASENARLRAENAQLRAAYGITSAEEHPLSALQAPSPFTGTNAEFGYAALPL